MTSNGAARDKTRIPSLENLSEAICDLSSWQEQRLTVLENKMERKEDSNDLNIKWEMEKVKADVNSYIYPT